MKKIISLLIFSLTILILSACRPDDIIQQTPPSFSHIIVEDRSPIVDGEIEPYIVNKQEMIRVEVHLNNPSNFRINTVTINQTTYRTNRFDETSTNEMIVLYLSVGQITGLTQYVVQRIEYLDESDAVRGFNVTQNNEYDVFVLKSLPTATISSFSLQSEALQFEISLIDIDQVVILGTAQARLYLDGVLVETRSLNRGVNSLTFSDLLSDETYDLIVKVDYDLEDGQGTQNDYLLVDNQPFTTTAKTSPASTISNIRVTENSITFNVSLQDPSGVLVEEGLQAVLFQNGDIVQSKILTVGALNNIVFDGLLNNNQFTIEIRADYDLNDATGLRENVLLASTNAQTTAREIPTLSAQVISVSENRLVLNIDASNLIGQGIVDLSTLTALLYNNDTQALLSETDLLDGQLIFEVDRLLSNNFIRIEIKADYDLQDGQGTQRDTIFETVINTSANIKPSATISAMTLTQTSVSFTTALANPSQTVVPNTFVAHLYENNVLVRTLVLPTQSGTYTFENIDVFYSNSYTVKVFADYDLRDGAGRVEDVQLFTYTKTSAAPKAPSALITSIVEVSTGYQVNYQVFDNDDTIDSLRLKVGSLVIPIDVNQTSVIVEDLSNNVLYNFQIEASYDLSDTSGLQIHTLYEQNFTTRALSAPEISVDAAPDNDEIAFNLTISNPDATLLTTWVELRFNNDLIDELDGVTSGTFASLLSNRTYQVIVYYSYDLNDDMGERQGQTSIEVTTLESLPPTAEITNILFHKGQVTLSVLTTDQDSVIVENSLFAVLYKNGVEVAREALTSLEQDVTFLELLNNSEYTVRIVADYTLDDGVIYDEVVLTSTTFTSLDVTPTINMTQTLRKESMRLRITYLDEYNVLTNTILSIRFYDEADTLVGSYTMFTKELSLEFFELWSDHNYRIEIWANVDFEDGLGSQNVQIFEQLAKTQAQVKPSPSFGSISVTGSDINVDISGYNDPDTVLVEDSVELILYENGIEIDRITYIIGTNEYTFTDVFTSANEYTIELIGQVDLNTPAGVDEITFDSITFVISE